jgi:flavin-dependent dehydrogenase
MMKVAVVGANVAGSYFAHLLARPGIQVDLFDPRAPWHKPCGGGITRKAVAEFDLLTTAAGAESTTSFHLTAPSGTDVTITTEEPLYLLARIDLSRLLLGMAADHGAALHRERVRGLARDRHGRWSLITHAGEYSGYDYLVGADGAASTVRRSVDRPFAREDLILAVDYHLAATDLTPHVALKFLGGGMGYIWFFAGRSYGSLGIGAPAARARSEHLEKVLRRFVGEQYPMLNFAGVPRSQWVIPFHREGFHDRYRIQGPSWSLLGDAAGLADPMTGEGIYYALKSASLLAESLVQGRPEGYPAAVDSQIRPELNKAYGITRDYFSKRFLNLVIGFARRSPSLSAVLGEYLTGTASYRVARKKLQARSWAILWEAIRPRRGLGREVEEGVRKNAP